MGPKEWERESPWQVRNPSRSGSIKKGPEFSGPFFVRNADEIGNAFFREMASDANVPCIANGRSLIGNATL